METCVEVAAHKSGPTLLQQYASMCTTCIVGKAVDESGGGGYDEESVFERSDLLDTEFPMTFMDDDADLSRRPDHVLMELCGGFTEEIVSIIGEMEASWASCSREVKPAGVTKASLLWEFVRDDAAVYIQRLYGEQRSTEFVAIGEDIFALVRV